MLTSRWRVPPAQGTGGWNHFYRQHRQRCPRDDRVPPSVHEREGEQMFIKYTFHVSTSTSKTENIFYLCICFCTISLHFFHFFLFHYLPIFLYFPFFPFFLIFLHFSNIPTKNALRQLRQRWRVPTLNNRSKGS